MQAERRKLKRLQRLEHIRAMAKQTALAEAARAEQMLSQLQSLSLRTSQLAQDYAARPPASTGHDLKRMTQFIGGLNGILISTQNDTARAATLANASQAALAQAEQRRAAAETRAIAQTQLISAKNQRLQLGGKRTPRSEESSAGPPAERAIGTALE